MCRQTLAWTTETVITWLRGWPNWATLPSRKEEVNLLPGEGRGEQVNFEMAVWLLGMLLSKLLIPRKGYPNRKVRARISAKGLLSREVAEYQHYNHPPPCADAQC